MSDMLWVTVIVLSVALAFFLYAIGGWAYIGAALKGKKMLPDGIGLFKKKRLRTIVFEFSEKNNMRMPFNGGKEISAEEIAIFDGNGKPAEYIRERDHMITFASLKAFLRNPNVAVIRIQPNNYNSNLQTELVAANMQIVQLQEKYKALSRSFNSVREELAREQNRLWRIENAGKRVQVVKQGDGKTQQDAATMPEVREE